VTFRSPRGSAADTDSGAGIAQVLGLETYEFDRLDYLQADGFPEVEFLGWAAQELGLAAHLERRLVFTGFNGDKVWDRNCKEVTPNIVRGDSSGHHLSEFRLRLGWLHLPVPFLGCTGHPFIHRISTSPEMEPWSLKNHYDRPIPRRLLEEAGVPRNEFGITKQAAGIDLVSEGLKTRVTAASYDEFMRYWQQHSTAGLGVRRRWLEFLKAVYQRQYAGNRRIKKFVQEKVGIAITLPLVVPRDMRIGQSGDLDMLALLVPWATHKLTLRYAAARSVPPASGLKGSIEPQA